MYDPLFDPDLPRKQMIFAASVGFILGLMVLIAYFK